MKIHYSSKMKLFPFLVLTLTLLNTTTTQLVGNSYEAPLTNFMAIPPRPIPPQRKAPPPRPPVQPNSKSSYVTSSTVSVSSSSSSINYGETFATELYVNVVRNVSRNKNVVMSPFAIEANLGLLYCGSEGKTAMLMAERLTFINGAAQAVGQGFYDVLQPWQHNKALELANDIFISETYLIQPVYKFIAERQFFTKVRTIDFYKLAQAQTYINDWVADDTNNKITSVIEPGLLKKNTPMVAVSGINFRNKWKQQFNVKRTTMQPFYANGNCESTKAPSVPTMNIEGIFNYAYAEQLDAQIVQIPLLNSNVSMFIVVPRTCSGYSKLDTAIPKFDAQTIFHMMKPEHVNIMLPRFEVRSQFDLKHALSNLGLNLLFTDNANFDCMLDNGSSSSQMFLHVGPMIHQAVITVNEDGIEPGSAKKNAPSPNLYKTGKIPSVQFKANHPFLFIAASQQEILLMGRISNP